MINLNMIFGDQIICMFIMFTIAVLGGIIFLKLNIPAGPVLGAMFFAMIFSVICGGCYIPNFILIASRIIAGTLIGSRILRSNFLSLRRIFVPMLFFTFFILMLSIVAGFVICNISEINKASAFFGSAPGGLIDMSLISVEFGADISIVALLQTVRVISCITVIPFIVKIVAKKDRKSVV